MTMLRFSRGFHTARVLHRLTSNLQADKLILRIFATRPVKAFCSLKNQIQQLHTLLAESQAAKTTIYIFHDCQHYLFTVLGKFTSQFMQSIPPQATNKSSSVRQKRKLGSQVLNRVHEKRFSWYHGITEEFTKQACCSSVSLHSV